MVSGGVNKSTQPKELSPNAFVNKVGSTFYFTLNANKLCYSCLLLLSEKSNTLTI